MATIWYASKKDDCPIFFGRLENHVFCGETLSPKHPQWIESHITLPITHYTLHYNITHYMTMFGGFGFLCGESCGKSPPFLMFKPWNVMWFFSPGDRRVWTQEEATSFHTDSTRFKRTCRDNFKKTLVNEHSH